MQVSDLYMILRELQQIATLQANLAAILATDPSMSTASIAQDKAQTQLKEIMNDYEQYTL